MLSTQAYIDQLPNGAPPFTDIASARGPDRRRRGSARSPAPSSGTNPATTPLAPSPPGPSASSTRGRSPRCPRCSWTTDGGSACGAVDEPAVHAAEVLTDLLEDRGVEIDGRPAQPGSHRRAPRRSRSSPSLTVAELVAQALRFSDNTTTELLVKEIDARSVAAGRPRPGSWRSASWLADSGLPTEGVGFDDGSGLSDNDRLRCDLLAGLLVDQGPDRSGRRGPGTARSNPAPSTID